jgi:ribosomal protein L7Ae-like RNA K-turn-binding protein
LQRGKSPPEAEALGLLGLARRAGALALGTQEARRLLASGRIRLILFAADASHKQLDKVRGLAEGRGVPVRWVSRRIVMGKAVGAGPLSVVGIREGSFAEQLLRGLPAEPSVQDAREGGPLVEQEELEGHAGR